MTNNAPTPIRIDSAEDPENERVVAPQGYRPHHVAAPAVVDNTLHGTQPIPAWRDYLASGSTQPTWFLIAPLGDAHFVEKLRTGEQYEASGQDYRHRFDNAYDAFWTAEVLAKTFTDNRSAEFHPRRMMGQGDR